MTISSETVNVDYIGDGVTTIWAYGFLIPFLDDGITPAVAVIHNASGTDGTYVLGVDYTISGVNSPAGGNITFAVAPALNVEFTIRRQLTYTQDTAVPNQAFLPNTIEQISDRIVEQIQQLIWNIKHCFRLSETQGLATAVAMQAAQRANLFLGFDGSGNLAVKNAFAYAKGTFVANGTTPVAVPYVGMLLTTVVAIDFNTLGGTQGAQPVIVSKTPGVGFSVKATALDTSIYNWAAIG